jgi:hypothetical protein
VEWWEIVWHKHVSPRFSLILHGLLFVRSFLLKISSCLMVLFRLIGFSYVGVVVKMLIIYFFIIHSLSASSMIFALNAALFSDVDLGLVPLHGLLLWVDVDLLNL